MSDPSESTTDNVQIQSEPFNYTEMEVDQLRIDEHYDDVFAVVMSMEDDDDAPDVFCGLALTQIFAEFFCLSPVMFELVWTVRKEADERGDQETVELCDEVIGQFSHEALAGIFGEDAELAEDIVDEDDDIPPEYL